MTSDNDDAVAACGAGLYFMKLPNILSNPSSRIHIRRPHSRPSDQLLGLGDPAGF